MHEPHYSLQYAISLHIGLMVGTRCRQKVLPTIQHVAEPQQYSAIEAAPGRVKQLFDTHDTHIVSFSGGKDSTAVFHLAYLEARKRGKPLHVMFFDDEIIDPDTDEYTNYVMHLPGVVPHWICVPIRHNLSSELRPAWWTWDPDERAVWFRPLPELAITEIEGWEKGAGAMKAASELYVDQTWLSKNEDEKVCIYVGVRAAESLTRRRAILLGGNWMHQRRNHTYAKPIYDLNNLDVWRYIAQHDRYCDCGLSQLPYTKAYDKIARLGREAITQIRIAAWGNPRASARDGDKWAQLYPDTWQRALNRLPELDAQSRYGKSTLFLRNKQLPMGMTWQEYAWHILTQLDTDSQAFWQQQIERLLRRWASTHTQPFPDTAASMGNGEHEMQCWQRVCFMLVKNDRIGSGSRDLV
jgi:predicted phosphoadenosine phosphosulfate sulfurtransferase